MIDYFDTSTFSVARVKTINNFKTVFFYQRRVKTNRLSKRLLNLWRQNLY